MVAVAVMFGSNDIDRAKDFYDQVLAVIGGKPMMEHSSGGRIYAGPTGAPLLSVVRPFNGAPATAGNGTMATLSCDSPDQVGAMHAKAIALGGQDEGAPGPRGGEASGVTAAYFRDLDGNKICVLHFKPA